MGGMRTGRLVGKLTAERGRDRTTGRPLITIEDQNRLMRVRQPHGFDYDPVPGGFRPRKHDNGRGSRATAAVRWQGS